MNRSQLYYCLTNFPVIAAIHESRFYKEQNSTRTVTSIVRVANREDTKVSVKTSCPIPKENIFDVMENIRAASVDAPVKIGDVIIHDLFGADVIATKDII
jgi:CxxC motif-containing protein